MARDAIEVWLDAEQDDSALLRGAQAVIERRAATSDDVATIWITGAELHHGAAKSKAPEKNRALATSFLATRLADADLFIAAIAVAQRGTVVTGNRCSTRLRPRSSARPRRSSSARVLTGAAWL